MTKAMYQGLSPQIRKALDENSGEAQTRRVGTFVDQLTATVQQRLESQAGEQTAKLGPELLAKRQARAEPMITAGPIPTMRTARSLTPHANSLLNSRRASKGKGRDYG